MSQVVRDKKACLNRLVKAKDGSVLTREHCRIQVPQRWFDIKLGSITDITTVYGFFPIIFDDDKYTVMNICAMMDITPSRTTTVTINEESYYEFHFDANTQVIRTLTLVKVDTLTYNVFDEFIMKSKVPWWGSIDDLCSLFDSAQKHAGSFIGKVPQSTEFLVGVIARRIEERSKFLRQTAKNLEDYNIDKIEFVPLLSVLYSVNNTVSKLSGAYFNDGVVSAIVNPSTKTSKVEKILRT